MTKSASAIEAAFWAAGFAALSICGFSSVATAKPPSASKATAAALDSQNIQIVASANAFLATLSDTQKKSVLFSFSDAAQRARWSNFPTGVVPRAGLRRGALNEAQLAALTGMLKTVLSNQGMRMLKEQMDADDVLKANPGLGGGPGGPGSGPGRGPRGVGGMPAQGRPAGAPAGGFSGGPGGSPNFGSDFYYVAFLGTPSVTAPWMLQFGGHHLAINATMVGSNLTLAPSLTGGQPTKYTKDGKAVYIVEQEVEQAKAMLAGLSAAQQKKAVLSPQRIDLVLGPGHDGQTLQPEGLPGSEMTEAQKTQLLALITARLGIINAHDFATTMTPIRKNLSKTYFAWFGPTTDAGSAYFRVTGPTIILEFSPQDLGGDASNHLHNMYRDPTNDYGSAWTRLK